MNERALRDMSPEMLELLALRLEREPRVSDEIPS